MRSLSDTIARLGAMRAARGKTPVLSEDRLSDLVGFGSNPGGLRGRFYAPYGLSDESPLVVVLHGCTQTAAGYDHGSGWSRLADAHGFALLFPEQTRAKNPNLCFNWFLREDSRRGAGEPASIRQMIGKMVDDHRIDPRRIYVTGLSAGGAMTAVMLATYPEAFAAGAIIAGLPYGCATNTPEAFDLMRGRRPAGVDLATRVRQASGHQGRWPRVSIWHGDADATVSDANADALLEQWRNLHGLVLAPSATERGAGYVRRAWRSRDGADLVEDVRIAGLGHGTPLATAGAEACGAVGPYMLEAGLSSTFQIARFFGILHDDAPALKAPGGRAAKAADAPDFETPGGGVAKVIEDALRAAGLKR